MDEIINQDPQTSAKMCGCEDGSCPHEDATAPQEGENVFTKHHNNDEIALAFLLALTPLVVLTFFGQVGLL